MCSSHARGGRQNAPDEFDSVYLQPGVSKMVSTVDTKLQNAVFFTINLEDHTIGQLLWAQLLTDPTVVRVASWLVLSCML